MVVNDATRLRAARPFRAFIAQGRHFAVWMSTLSSFKTYAVLGCIFTLVAAFSADTSRTACSRASLSFFILSLIAWGSKDLSNPMLRLLQAFSIILLSIFSAADKTCITSCRTEAGVLQWLPAASVGLAVIILGLSTLLDVRWCRSALAVTASIAIAVHVALQIVLPRLCPKCLLVVTIALVGVHLANSSPEKSQLNRSRWLSITFALALASSVAVMRSDQPRSYIASLQGLPISSIHESVFTSQGSGVLLLTLPGCPACHDAKVLLRDLGVQYVERSVNEVVRRSPTPLEPVAPQLFKVDDGVISQHVLGFATKAYKEALQ